MNFQDSIKTCFTKYVDFKGRASRSEYWWFLLLYAIVVFVASIINENLPILVMLGFMLPLIAAGVRRLHDTNRTGWLYLLCLIPLIGAIILIVFFVQEGTPGPNLYGNPPAP